MWGFGGPLWTGTELQNILSHSVDMFPAELGEDDALSHFNSHLQPTDCHVVHIRGLFRDDFAA